MEDVMVIVNRRLKVARRLFPVETDADGNDMDLRGKQIKDDRLVKSTFNGPHRTTSCIQKRSEPEAGTLSTMKKNRMDPEQVPSKSISSQKQTSWTCSWSSTWSTSSATSSCPLDDVPHAEWNGTAFSSIYQSLDGMCKRKQRGYAGFSYKTR